LAFFLGGCVCGWGASAEGPRGQSARRCFGCVGWVCGWGLSGRYQGTDHPALILGGGLGVRPLETVLLALLRCCGVGLRLGPRQKDPGDSPPCVVWWRWWVSVGWDLGGRSQGTGHSAMFFARVWLLLGFWPGVLEDRPPCVG